MCIVHGLPLTSLKEILAYGISHRLIHMFKPEGRYWYNVIEKFQPDAVFFTGVQRWDSGYIDARGLLSWGRVRAMVVETSMYTSTRWTDLGLTIE